MFMKSELEVDSKSVGECYAQTDGQPENLLPPSHLHDLQRHKKTFLKCEKASKYVILKQRSVNRIKQPRK